MTLPRQNSATPEAVWSSLRSVVWRGFRFETGSFLLHVPSSHVLEAPLELVQQVNGEVSDVELQAELDRIADELPLPARREVKTDIRAVSLNMAQGCNLRCTYCFAGEGDYGTKAMMSLETAVKALEMLAAGKDTFHVVFFGGEPLLNFSVIQQVVAWCEQQSGTRYTFAVTTNGTLLTAEKIAWMRAKRFSMNLSYDGKGLQARQRLNKDKVSNSEALVERKLASFGEQLGHLRDFRLRATITRQNLDLLEEAVVGTLTSTNFKVYVSHHTAALSSLVFTSEDIDRLGEIFRSVVDRFLAAGDYERLLRLENVKKWVKTLHHGETAQLACGAGVNYLTVSAEGGYYLCHRFNEDASEAFGSIDSGLDQDRLAEVRRFRGASLDPCKSCWMRQWCAGGCFHDHKTAGGHKFKIDPLYCKLQNLEIEQAMRVYTVLLQKAPELLEA